MSLKLKFHVRAMATEAAFAALLPALMVILGAVIHAADPSSGDAFQSWMRYCAVMWAILTAALVGTGTYRRVTELRRLRSPVGSPRSSREP